MDSCPALRARITRTLFAATDFRQSAQKAGEIYLFTNRGKYAILGKK